MSEPRPERWSIDAGDADVAVLDVPPAEGRTRRFEIDVRFVVRCPADATGAGEVAGEAPSPPGEGGRQASAGWGSGD